MGRVSGRRPVKTSETRARDPINGSSAFLCVAESTTGLIMVGQTLLASMRSYSDNMLPRWEHAPRRARW